MTMNRRSFLGRASAAVAALPFLARLPRAEAASDVEPDTATQAAIKKRLPDDIPVVSAHAELLDFMQSHGMTPAQCAQAVGLQRNARSRRLIAGVEYVPSTDSWRAHADLGLAAWLRDNN